MNQQLIEAIVNDGKFPHAFKKREYIETHISFIILGTLFAYKFKKELSFSFLDFSTLAKRKFYCERELMLNNRLTTGIYLDVVPVRQEKKIISVGSGKGQIIDYAIKMKRMKDAKQMHLMLENQEVKAQHILELAKLIHKFHDRTQVIHSKFKLDHFESRFNDLRSVSDVVKTQLGTAGVEIIRQAVRSSGRFLKSHQKLFESRIEHGFVRDCHGDLHSRNIFLYARPVIFDCIEFNDEFRQIDILDELAFFCMDLEAAGFKKLSLYFTSQYFKKKEKEFGPAEKLLFTYYQAYRANVRAKVNALRVRTAKGKELKQSMAEVKKYLTLMNRYMQRLS